MTPLERKRYIVEQRSAGRKITHIANDLGVTKQAVSLVWKDYEKRGDAIFTKRPGGRLRERDTLTAEERTRLVAWLKQHTPADIGSKEPQWTLKTTKRAALELLGKRINLEKAHAVFHGDPDICPGVSGVSDPRYRPAGEADAEAGPGEAEAAAPDAGNPQSAETDGADDEAMPSLEEMERKNAETRGKLPEEGKRRKGNPATPSKKRKRKRGK